MSQTVNLNRYRKQKARDKARQQADANAARHGRTKGERAAAEAEANRAARQLDGLKRDD